MNMMENYKRRVVSCVEKENRINKLPEHLIDSILERLPVQDAARTSILSKIWRYKWTTMRSLAFDEDFSNKFSKNGAFGHNGFIRIINQVLFFHKGPILRFHIDIPDMLLDSFQEVDQWMLFVSRNGVKELFVVNSISNGRYEIPCYVFSCLELTHLELGSCRFKQPPLEFEGFFNLKELELVDIDFGASLCGTKINLPELKTLWMYECTNVYNFNIKATKLQHLSISACPDAMLLKLLDSPSLFTVWIALVEPLEEFARVEKMNLATMLSNLPRVKLFTIDGHLIKFLMAEKIPKLLPREISSLKRLQLQNFQLGDLDHIHGALCLLRNSPNLESLFITLVQAPQVDVGPASNHLECPKCLDCTLNQLKTVEIRFLRGLRPELLFIKLLLAHSPSLEKFTILPSGACNVQEILDIAKEVMLFPRASPKAKLIYLNPL